MSGTEAFKDLSLSSPKMEKRRRKEKISHGRDRPRQDILYKLHFHRTICFQRRYK